MTEEHKKVIDEIRKLCLENGILEFRTDAEAENAEVYRHNGDIERYAWEKDQITFSDSAPGRRY